MAEELEVGVLLTGQDKGMAPVLDRASDAAQRLVGQLDKTNKALLVLGGIVGAGAFATYKFGKQAFSAAARVSELKVSIDAIGESTGLGAKKINDAAKSIAKQGIEMAASQKIAIEFAQANINLADAAQVARTGQDLAVISQKNSTQVAELLTRAIRTGNSMLLKSAGVSRMASEGYAMYAKQIGKTTQTLTAQERQQAIINLILDEGKRVAGVYEASMTEAGKVLRSFPRLINDMQVAFGSALLQGFGPAIKAAYDVTNAFSKLIVEGGALNPILVQLGKAMEMMFTPITRGLSALSDFFKRLNYGSISVDGLGDSMGRLLPTILAVATGLAALAGKSLLGLNKFTAGFAKFLPGVSAGFAVLVVLTPKLRDALLQMIGAFTPLLPALASIGGILTDAITRATDVVGDLAMTLANVFGGAVKMLTPVVNGLAVVLDKLRVPLTFLVGFIGVKYVAALMAAKMAKISLALASGQATGAIALTAKTAAFATKAYQNFAFGVATTGSVMKAFGGTTVAVMRAATASVVSFLAAAWPMLALTAVIVGVTYALNKLGEAKRKQKEVTESVTGAIKAQVAELAKTNEALAAYLSNVDALNAGIYESDEVTDKFRLAMRGLGLDQSQVVDTLQGLRMGGDEWVRSMFEQHGLLDELSRATYMYMDPFNRGEQTAGKRWFVNASEGAQRLITDIMVLQREGKKVDLEAILGNERKLMELKSKDAFEAYKRADAIAAEKVAMGELTDMVERQLFVRSEAQVILQGMADAEAKVGAEAAKAAPDLRTMTQRLRDMEIASADGKATFDEMYGTMYGIGQLDFFKQTEQMYEMRQAMTQLNDSVVNSKGNFGQLEGAALSLAKQIGNNAAQMKNMEFAEEEIAAMQQVLITNFLASAEAAGWSEERVHGVLKALGLLDGYKSIAVIDADISAAKAKIEAIAKALATISDDADRSKFEAVIRALNSEIAGLERSKKSLEDMRERLSALDKAARNAGKGTKEFSDAQKELRDKILKVVNDALAKQEEKLGELTAKHNAMREGIRNTVYQTANLGNAMQEATRRMLEHNAAVDAAEQAQQAYAQQVSQAIRGTLSLSRAHSTAQESVNRLEQSYVSLQDAAEDYTYSQAELSGVLAQEGQKINKLMREQRDLEELLASPIGRYNRQQFEMQLREKQVQLAEQLEDSQSRAGDAAMRLAESERRLAQAIQETNDAGAAQLTFLEALRKQAAEAREFGSVLQQLLDAGLTQAALDEIIGAGAVVGTQMGKELLAGGSVAIGEVNTLYGEIAAEAERAGAILSQKFHSVGERAGLDFMGGLRAREHMAREFAAKIEKLVAMRLSPANIQAVLNAGLEAGNAIADELIRGGQEAIDASNKIEQELYELSEKLGLQLGDDFFKTGMNLAQDLINGFRKQLEKLEKELAKAKSLQELNKLLGKVKVDVARSTAQQGTSGSSDPLGQYDNPAVRGGLLELTPFAKGGIVRKPTIGLIGEAGPEAVVPLRDYDSGPTIVNININSLVADDTLPDRIVDALRTYNRRKGAIRVLVR